ncbi:MAG: imidazoleglycerol-phosphate dehydratase HisB [Clostridiaceae bacterium]|nr:imidazoleglycerol-phosphate dehydratase HisB [Bacillota bacterium]NLI37770.1 imidazoleglycerol-phosphate dehydratase HisB [Clostridiaceae bacterium]
MRRADIARKTKETDIRLALNLDGEGKNTIASGIGFLDHMLCLFSGHGRFDLELNCSGDLDVDTHHTVEDIGIVLGKAIFEALGSRESIKRYGSALIPMDESLAQVSLDLSNRPYLYFDIPFSNPQVGGMDTEMFEEFFRALAVNAGMTLHISILHGKNNHHMIEAAFKAFARALREAVTIDPSIKGVNSTKGML